MWDYTGAEADEMTFKAGQIITVSKQDGEWWTGVLQGQTAQKLFPASYCQPC